MLSDGLPLVFAIFICWFSTGLVLLLDNLPHSTFRWSLVISTLVAAGAFWGLAHTANQTTVAGAYCAFTCALLVWGWHELSFLTGWITGPRRVVATPGAQGWQRFSEAVQAILWHEIGIIAAGVAIVWLTWGAANQVGSWTFLVLWAMRTSAKLNLFYGVRNLSEEFLPPQLKYLQTYFRRRPMNMLFPLVVTAATVVTTLVVMAAFAPGSSAAARTGLMLVATLLGLAILEHWLLVLPIEATALWRWAMRRRAAKLAAPEHAPDNTLMHAR